MSYILDALKKSDQERKQGDVPTLQTVHIPIAVEQHTPWLLYGVILLLLLMLAFVIGLVVPTESNKVVSVNEPSSRIELSKKEGRSQQHKPIPSSKDRSQQHIQAVPQKKRSKVVVHDLEVKKRVAINNSRQPIEKTNEILHIPYLHELEDYKQQSVPVLTFAGHIYSSQASSRSVIINGRSMSEGDIIVEGLKVEVITGNGVILSLYGESFRMDILQDWSFD